VTFCFVVEISYSALYLAVEGRSRNSSLVVVTKLSSVLYIFVCFFKCFVGFCYVIFKDFVVS